MDLTIEPLLTAPMNRRRLAREPNSGCTLYLP